MKIALFHNLPSGGAKRALYEFVKRLHREHTIDLFRFDVTNENFLPLGNWVENEYVFNLRGTMPASLRLRRQWPKFFLFPALQKASLAMARQIEQSGYDLAFVNQCQEVNSPYLLRYLKIPTVYYCQEAYRELEPMRNHTHAGSKESIKRLIRHCYARLDSHNAGNASMILANSSYSRETLYRAYGVFANLSPLGVDTEQFYPMGLARKRCILSVGALDVHKAQELILHSAFLINPKPDVCFVYNWSAPGRKQYLQRLADKLGINLRLRQGISEEELVRTYNTVSVTACTSIMEPFGLTALESMASGTPVVAVREGGYRETVRDGETGFLAERNASDLASLLARLLDDSSLRERLALAARQHVVQHWTWKQAYQALTSNLHRLVGNQQSWRTK